jgi:acyl-CoA reductase-like NAD-dependent aldehyde dehydrogenase
MLRESYPYYLANRAEYANGDLPVIDKYTGKVATGVALADEAAIDQAIGAAVVASSCTRACTRSSRTGWSPPRRH